MTDWTRFRGLQGTGVPAVQIMSFVSHIEGCASLQQDEGLAALQTYAKTLAQTDLRNFNQALDCVQQKLRSTAGGSSEPKAPAGLQAFFARVQAGSSSIEEVNLYSRMFMIHSFASQWREKHPELTTTNMPESPETTALRDSLAALSVRVAQIAPQCAPGIFSNALLVELQHVLDDYRALIDRARWDSPAITEACCAAGHSASLLANGCLIAADAQAALRVFSQAAEYFERGNDHSNASECRRKLIEITHRLSNDNDRAAKIYLGTVLKGSDSLTLVDAHVTLADLSLRSNDTVGASAHAEAAVTILSRLGYADPSYIGVESAFESWISTASTAAPIDSLERRVMQLGTYFLSILKVRHVLALELGQDVARIELTLNELIQVMLEVPRQAERVAADAQEALARYLLIEPERDHSGADGNAFEEALAKGRVIDESLLAIRQQSDARDAREPREDLLAAIQNLEAQAEGLTANIFRVKVHLARAYLYLASGRASEVLDSSREARSILLAGQAPSLSVLQETFARTCYLESLEQEVMAHVIHGDFQSAWSVCEGVARDFETERYRIHNPYRQSSILRSVATLYKLGAFAAFKLCAWDDLIEITELFKARSAIRSRLLPEVPRLSDADLEQEFRRTGDELLGRPELDVEHALELRERRRNLWDLISLARVNQADELQGLPPLRLAAIQSELAEDEVVVAYYWLNEHALLILCIDRHRFLPTLSRLTPKQRRSLDDFTVFVQTFRVAQRSMDTTVTKIGGYLLPEACREFIAGKRRLVFSPNQELHLFPFHAVPWEREYIGTHFAVSYTPNLSSLLLHWEDRSSKPLLALAVGQFADPAVPPLLNVEGDAIAIQRMYAARGGRAETIAGSDVTRKRIDELRTSGDLSIYRCIHLGTHGLSVFADQDHPLESTLLLQDSSLDAIDIGNLRLSSEVAVLCACNSGQRAVAGRTSRDLPGDDIFGLQAAFFQSGVQSVLGSLWHVETVSSSALILGFHRWFAQGLDADEALQRSLQEYLSDPPAQQREIYYWAPYFLSFLGRKSRNDASVKC